MKTLTIQEAMSNLAAWVDQAIAGEEIGIRSGDTIVALKPVPASGDGAKAAEMSPREALRRLQEEARLTRSQAEDYLKEVRAERVATEDRGGA